MFERFTDRSRRAVVLSQEWAKKLDHDPIGTGHQLLGLISEEQGVAAKALTSLGVTLELARHQLEQIEPPGDPPSGHMPFTPRAKKALENSLRAALELGHNYVGTEHLLLGLIREREGPAFDVLTNLGADLAEVRERVIELLRRYGGIQPSQPEPARSRPAHDVEPSAAMREVIRLAEVEARGLRHGYVGTEHLFLGLFLAEPQPPPRVRDLLDESVTADVVRGHIIVLTGPGRYERPDPSLTGEAADALDLAHCAALGAGDAEVAPRHLLLALTGARRSLAVRLMTDFGVPERAASQVRDIERGTGPVPVRDLQLLAAIARQRAEPTAPAAKQAAAGSA